MRRVLKSLVAWTIIVLVASVLCLGASFLLLAVTSSVKTILSVYLFGGLLTVMWAGGFD